MVFNFKNRYLFSLVNYIECEIKYLLDLLCDLKCVKYVGIE